MSVQVGEVTEKRWSKAWRRKFDARKTWCSVLAFTERNQDQVRTLRCVSLFDFVARDSEPKNRRAEVRKELISDGLILVTPQLRPEMREPEISKFPSNLIQFSTKVGLECELDSSQQSTDRRSRQLGVTKSYRPLPALPSQKFRPKSPSPCN